MRAPDVCPICGESEWWGEIDKTHSGFSVKKAVVGGVLFGGLVGVLGGAHGKSKFTYVCTKCGFQHEYDKRATNNNTSPKVYVKEKESEIKEEQARLMMHDNIVLKKKENCVKGEEIKSRLLEYFDEKSFLYLSKYKEMLDDKFVDVLVYVLKTRSYTSSDIQSKFNVNESRAKRILNQLKNMGFIENGMLSCVDGDEAVSIMKDALL